MKRINSNIVWVAEYTTVISSVESPWLLLHGRPCIYEYPFYAQTARAGLRGAYR